MADRLAGKVAIVTGAGSSGPGVGNGKAASILFAREGARVLLVDRELDRAEETLRLIEEEGGTASAMGADVTSAADCEVMVRTAGPSRMVHLEQRMANDGHLAELSRKAREEMAEPARG